MVITKPSRSQEIRKSLDHPIIDSDGHILEFTPVLLDYMEQVAGAKMRDRFAQHLHRARGLHWYSLSDAERRDSWTTIPAWWFAPTKNTVDRATAHLPRLLTERMDELAIDFAVLYPTMGLMFDRIRDPEVRIAACRALNNYMADVFSGYGYRITPAAAIPMETPEVALEELTYASQKLGLKVAMVEGWVRRPIPKVVREHPELAGQVTRLDLIGLDSEYDYDPFWAKCLELGVAPASHSADIALAASYSSYMFNHIGTFARPHAQFCKSLFMGGVTRRFPDLRIAFLEGGVGWACALYSDIIGHWEKRNARAIQDLDPRKLDLEHFFQLINEYGDPMVKSRFEKVRDTFVTPEPGPEQTDEWHKVGIERAEEIKDLFMEPFYFGCEADDPINAWAFNANVNPFGARLKAIFSSDIGHWDVPDMREVVEEAYELVEHELITEEDFRDFTFANAATLYGGMDPDFFKGTAVEAEAARVLQN